MAIGENSRYRRSVVVISVDSLGVVNRRAWASRVKVPTDLPIRGLNVYEVQQSDTWYTLAARFFGNSTLWWVLGWYNTVIDPFEFLERGKKIFVPSRNIVYFDVLDVEEPTTLGAAS